MKVKSGIFQLSLNRKITLLTLSTFFAAFLFCVCLITLIFSRQARERDREAVLAASQRISQRINNYMAENDLAANTVIYSSWVQQLFIEGGHPSFQTRSQATGFLSNYSSMFGDLKCFIDMPEEAYLQSNTDFKIASSYEIEEQEWYEELLEKGKYRIYGHNDMFIKNVPDTSLTTYYLVKSIYSRKIIGYFVTNINYSQFRMLGQLTDANEKIRICDRNGNIVYENRDFEESLKKMDIDACEEEVESEETHICVSRNQILYTGELLDGNWSLSIIGESTPIPEIVRNNISVFLLLIPVSGIFLMMSLVLSRYLKKPIVLCTKALREVRNQNYSVTIPNHYHDEIGDMIAGFNDMSMNIKSLIDQNRLMYKARQQAEFRILQQRINPHFLCNTLEIINGMILCGEEENALQLSGMLGTMYRYDLGDSDLAPVWEELGYLRNYLAILSYKYRNLQVDYQVDEEAKEYVIPKFVCQPLVENALKHGFSEMVSGCRIGITLKKNGSRLVIRVEDNGKGMKPEILEELHREIERLRTDQGTAIERHIGILNTAQRIFLHYGSECRFTIESEEKKGTVVEIILPMEA